MKMTLRIVQVISLKLTDDQFVSLQLEIPMSSPYRNIVPTLVQD